MDDLKQNKIENLAFQLTSNEILAFNENSFTFFDSEISNKDMIGKFLINNSLLGVFKIIFVARLTLILTATTNFKFANYSDRPLNSVAIEGIDSKSIIEQIKSLIIKTY